MHCFLLEILRISGLLASIHGTKRRRDGEAGSLQKRSRTQPVVEIQPTWKLLTDTQTQETFYDTNQSLGQAKFGVVQMVYSESDGKFYAMKKFNRATRNAAQRAMSQAAILEEAQKVKGVVRYKTVFADTFYLNLVVEYMENGSLTDYMSRKQLTYLGEDAAAYFAYQTALVLIGLRKEKILHRDVTPGNIFIGARGECKVTLSMASNPVRISDPVGTIEYAAPEIFDRESYPRGYNYKVDWWMLGITIYEIAFGMQLFADEEEILSKQITFPANASQYLIALLLGLLNRDPRTRLSEQQVTGHDWFKNKNYTLMTIEGCSLQGVVINSLHMH